MGAALVAPIAFAHNQPRAGTQFKSSCRKPCGCEPSSLGCTDRSHVLTPGEDNKETSMTFAVPARRTMVLGALLAAAWALPALAHAPSPAPAPAAPSAAPVVTTTTNAAYLAANCANCHGTKGKAVGGMPNLAGQNRDYIIAQMRAFRDGQRPATIMHQLAKGYTDDQIALIADHFSKIKN
jgi:cytochrome subunit of sulfide dehydrogenase